MKKIVLWFFASVMMTCVCRAQDDEIFTRVSSHEDFSLKDVKVLAIPTQGAYFVSGNELYALSEESELKGMVFPVSMAIDDIIWNETDFIIKSGNMVYAFNDISTPRLRFETDDFRIFPCDKGNIYVVRELGDTSILYMANLKLKKTRRMLNLPGNILDISKRNDALWVTTNECIYKFKDSKCQILLWFDKKVHSVTMADGGLLFATEDEINILVGENHFVTLFRGGNRGLLYDGEWLYLITDLYDLVRCAGFYIDVFLMMLDAIPVMESE